MMVNEPATQTFVRPEGHTCHVSTGIHGHLTFGDGKLDANGFWSIPCGECAGAHEMQFPECGPCWPHTEKQLKAMGLGDKIPPV